MSGRTIIFLILAIIVAFTAIVLKNRMSQTPEPVAEAPVPVGKVLVTTRDVAQGNFVQAQDLVWKDMGEDVAKNPAYVHEGSSSLEAYNGAVVRRSLRANEPVPQNAITRAGDGGFLSAVLEPGMRAISISVDATSGNAGFVSPGDRVDLIVTHRMRATGNQSNDTVASEIFVRDCRVVAIDQMLDNPENKAVLVKTVTVEVPPKDAAKIGVAMEMGKVSLALRSIVDGDKDTKNPVDAGFTRDSDLSRILNRGGAGMRVHVIRGDKVEDVEFNRSMQ
jgi:pilus assembly protein CpaB